MVDASGKKRLCVPVEIRNPMGFSHERKREEGKGVYEGTIGGEPRVVNGLTAVVKIYKICHKPWRMLCGFDNPLRKGSKIVLFG